MFLGINWAPWLPAITAVSILFTVLAGILGIFSDRHTKKGKLTPSGWTLAALLVGAGAITLLSGRADKDITDAKERADAAERHRQFQTQMTELQTSTRAVQRLQTDMQNSLLEQHHQSTLAAENLHLSARLQQEARANTENVLRRVFEESNRVSVERIAIAVTSICPSPARYQDIPEIQRASITIRDTAGAEVKLSSRQVRQTGAGMMFDGFVGDLGEFEMFPPWRTARIFIELSGRSTSIGTSLDDRLRLTPEERRRAANPEPVVCYTCVRMFLNGRQVLAANAGLARATSFGGYVARFEDLQVNASRLPRFSE